MQNLFVRQAVYLSWQALHSSGGLSLRRCCSPVEPCGSWQLMQADLPSTRGRVVSDFLSFIPTLCSPLAILSAWHPVHSSSGLTSFFSALGSPACDVWHEAQSACTGLPEADGVSGTARLAGVGVVVGEHEARKTAAIIASGVWILVFGM